MFGSHGDVVRTEGRHLPAFCLERIAFEPESAPAAALAHRAACPECRAAVEDLERQRGAYLEVYPVRPFLALVTARAAPAARSAWRSPRWSLVAASAAVVLAGALAVLGQWPREDEVRLKGNGGALFRVFVSRGGAPARPLETGDVLRPGDVLRFGLVSPAPGHALVASIDEHGRLSRYYPQGPDGSAPVDGREYLQLLPGSVELDGSTGREWIVLVVSTSPVEQSRVAEALRRALGARRGDDLGPIPLSADFRVVSVTKAPP